MSEHTELPKELEEQVREIAAEESRKQASDGILTMEFLDGHGDEWTVVDMMKQFPIGRRGAMKAMGLIAIGYAAPTAVLHVMAGTAEADRAADTTESTLAPTDDFVVPGQADVGSLDADQVDVGGSRFAETGDTVITPTWGVAAQRSFSTTTQSYQNSIDWFLIPSVQWDVIVPDAAQGVIYSHVNPTDTMDVRLRNTTDGETIFEQTGSSGRVQTTVEYTPTTTNNTINIYWEIRSPDGSSVTAVDPWVSIGRKL